MPFHKRLSRTQQILLAIFCFPLLPFYLCYLCCASSEEDKEAPDTTEPQAEELGMRETNVQPSFTGQTVKTYNDGQQPVVTSQSNLRYVTVEIHPRQNTPQIRKKFSFGKGAQVFPKQTGQDNQGFQDDREQRGVTLPGGRDLYAYPWDKSSLKSLPIDLKQFKELDAYASKVDVGDSVENLVNVLLQKARSDLEKLRAIWIWTCYHIAYDVEGYHDKGKRSCEPADVFQSRKSVCGGYAHLFEQMCSIAGIQCKYLSGFSKGYSYKPGKVFQGDSDHAWNAVCLDGRWHLLDSTWGSGHVGDSCSKFTFRYDEFYFLTHPALFVNDHFPEDEKWQLLKPMLTLQQFERNMRYLTGFYTSGLVETSAETSVIETENGKATVFIESRSPTLFMAKLNLVDEHCLMNLQRNGMMLDVYPPQTGTHSLDIYARSPKDTKENYSQVLKYILKCSSVDKSICLPKALIQPVGPSWLSEEKGILEALPLGPVIHTDDGRCVVTFTRSQDLDFFATLDTNSSSVTEAMRRRHIWKTCRGSQAELKIHLPHAGEFALHIWAKKMSDPGSHHCALSYHLSCPNKSVKWPVFPMCYNIWQEGCELVTPLAGILPANREVQFKLKIPGIAEAYVKGRKTHQLTLSGDGFWEGSCNTSSDAKVQVQVLNNANDNHYSGLLEFIVESH